MVRRRYRQTYSAVDPFKPSVANSVRRLWSTKESTDNRTSNPSIVDDNDLTAPPKLATEARTVSWSELNPNVPTRTPNANLATIASTLPPHKFLLAFIFDTIPRQIYLLFLLYLPYLYFSRVSRLFEEAELSIKDIKRGLLDAARKNNEPWLFQGTTQQVTSDPYERLQKSWNEFVDALISEWNTLNIVSVLLLGALLTALQLDGASTDPLTRFTALISMICSLMSLMYGCMYIIRFGAMRKTYKVAEWAHEAKQNKTGIWWNVWIMLALPAVWLAWSIILYIVCIMSYVWRTGTDIDTTREPFTASQALAPRIVVSVVLFLGLVYLLKITTTLRRYGAIMDRAWQVRLQDWLEELCPTEVPQISMMVDPVGMQNADAMRLGVNAHNMHEKPTLGRDDVGSESSPNSPCASKQKLMDTHMSGRVHQTPGRVQELGPVTVTKIMPLTDSEGNPAFDDIPIPPEDVLRDSDERGTVSE
ncbi:hypothetical protein CVT24_000194 [Panaeolus cyanescens]|uniref:Uncharacterized protein n=1 Tax=Panaeolus cyanescens TaxID=181874 RepID=A0A409W312_9AGAR|nr:hypothetical protein CVT24_000194 [Panaeolus cyanescens]